MAGTEAAATAKKERALKQRCKKYGITPATYNAIGESQGWRCGICGRPQSDFKTSLNIDHIHFKIDVVRYTKGGWHAFTTFDGLSFEAFRSTKTEAIRFCRERALPYSVRGLLCPGRHGKPGHGCCNRLLGRVDERWWLQAADRYLSDPPARKCLTTL